MGGRRKIIASVIVFLLLGAIVNVAVAWGCVTRSHYKPEGMDVSSVDVWRSTWERLALPGWVAEPTLGMQKHMLGTRSLHVQGGEWDGINRRGEHVTGLRYMASEFCAGWPLLGLRYVQRLDRGNPGWRFQGRLNLNMPVAIGPSPYIALPMQPIWPGFAINTVFYAVILWVVFAAPFALRRRRRIRRGLCPACAYPVGESNVCTECGKTVPLSLARERARVRGDTS